NADGSFSLANPTTGGTFSFDYLLANAGGTDAATVTVEVLEPPAAGDDPPAGGILVVFFGNPAGTVVSSSGASTNLLANDTLGFPNASITSFGGGDLGGTVADNTAGSGVALAEGTLTVNADGSFSFANAFSGIFSFNYRLENAAGSADATVEIVVI
ncbi:MAG TPA: hypothetical protein IGS17_05655, partial [Oscillatoriales cyanobacterium M59_W2019_021]|nr:hypothetical protein [Oscillatoriales cyanobacterium M59_W2019_021]